MTILIVDDHAVIEEGLKSRVLKIIPNAEFVFAKKLRNAIALLRKWPIELVFCDLEFNNSPEIDGFVIAQKLLQKKPNLKIIAHTNYNSYRIMQKTLDAGFKSFLYKGCSHKDFADTVTNVIKNGSYTSESMKNLLKKRNTFLKTIFADSLYGISDLSNRELELTLLTKTTTDRNELAEIMGNSPSTIDSYLQQIISKLKLKNRQDVALFSLEFQEELLKFKK